MLFTDGYVDWMYIIKHQVSSDIIFTFYNLYTVSDILNYVVGRLAGVLKCIFLLTIAS